MRTNNLAKEKLLALIRDNFNAQELEQIGDFFEKTFIGAVLAEKYRASHITDEILDGRLAPEGFSKAIHDAAQGVLCERSRDYLDKRDYYSVWKQRQCPHYNKILDGVFNEPKYAYLKKYQNYQVFISHYCKEDWKLASELRDLLNSYAINTWTDHDDGGHYAGGEWDFEPNGQLAKEIKRRPIFILLATRHASERENVKKEVELNESIKEKDTRLRINLILEQLDAKAEQNLSIDSKIQYLKYFQQGQKITFNNVVLSVLHKYEILSGAPSTKTSRIAQNATVVEGKRGKVK